MPIPAPVQAFVDHQADAAPTTYDDLRVVVFNTTLKRSPEQSHTDGLLAIQKGIFERLGVRVDEVRIVDHTIPPGVYPDMREQGYDADDFPAIYRELVEPADIIVIAGPIWLGDQSSQTRVSTTSDPLPRRWRPGCGRPPRRRRPSWWRPLSTGRWSWCRTSRGWSGRRPGGSWRRPGWWR